MSKNKPGLSADIKEVNVSMSFPSACWISPHETGLWAKILPQHGPVVLQVLHELLIQLWRPVQAIQDVRICPKGQRQINTFCL